MPLDREQTHPSLLIHLVEETCEVVDAVEGGTDDGLREELGDLLLQVYFHARVAENGGRFTIDGAVRGIADRLVHRRPHVFGDGEVPENLHGVWKRRKRQEKGRASPLDGIARFMSSLAHTQKMITRTRSYEMPVGFPSKLVTAEGVGERVQALVARARASGVGADAAIREAPWGLEERIRQAEGPAGTT